MVSDASDLAAYGDWTVPPDEVKAVDPNWDGLKHRFDAVSFGAIELAVQFVTLDGSQIAASINGKRCLIEIVSLGETVQEPCRVVSPAALTSRCSLLRTPDRKPFWGRLNTSISRRYFDSVSIAAYSHFFSLLTSICFLLTATRDGSSVVGSSWVSESLCVSSRLRRESGQYRVS